MVDGAHPRSHWMQSRFGQAPHENVPMTRAGAKARRLGDDNRPTRCILTLAYLTSLCGCNVAPSRNILGSYFPSWMVCALLGIAVAAIARLILKSTGILQELPAPFVVILAVGCTATFAMWLLWLS